MTHSFSSLPVCLLLFALTVSEYLVPEPGRLLRPASAVRSFLTATGCVRCLVLALTSGVLIVGLSQLAELSLVTWLAGLVVAHAALDRLKRPLYHRSQPPPGVALWGLAAYFAGHAAYLLAFGAIWGLSVGPPVADTLVRMVGGRWAADIVSHTVSTGLIVSSGYIFIARGGAEIVRAVLDNLGLAHNEQTPGFQIGSVIGYLERFLLMTFILVGEYGAIGFVMTAKSIARYAGINESRELADYYLVGTLTSAAVAILIGSAVRWAI